jgi:hypothetical protein
MAPVDELSQPRSRRAWDRPLRLIVLGACVVVVGVFLFGPSLLNPLLRSAGLVPHPDRYTALYFSDPTALPVRHVRGEPMQFAFTIESHEASRRSFGYRISIGNGQASGETVAVGSVLLVRAG